MFNSSVQSGEAREKVRPQTTQGQVSNYDNERSTSQKQANPDNFLESWLLGRCPV